MLGMKIRKLRTELGISQLQLAGADMSRAFISLVENDRCKPSMDTLRLIAHRLGKSVEYFLEDSDSMAPSADLLLRTARQRLDEGDLAEAKSHLVQALEICQRTESPQVEAEAQFLHGRCLLKMGQYSEAADALEMALDLFTRIKKGVGIATTYHELGTCAYLSESYAMAKRLYRKAISASHKIKSLQEVRVRSLLRLGDVLCRLGEWEAAKGALREALGSSDPLATPDLSGAAALGLGWVSYLLGHLPEAASWNRQATELLRPINHPLLYRVLLHDAILDMSRNRWEHGYTLLRKCLGFYEEQGLVVDQAEVLGRMADYWQHKGQPAKARKLLLNGLDLLERRDDGMVRGSLYRQLGLIDLRVGNLVRAHSYLLISYELLRRVKASKEAASSLECLRMLKGAPGGDLESSSAPD